MEVFILAQIVDGENIYRKGMVIEEEALDDEKFVMSVFKEIYQTMKLTIKQIKAGDA